MELDAHSNASLDVVRRLLVALEAGDRATVFDLFHPEVEHRELPSKILPGGRTSDREAMAAAFERGAALLSAQRYVLRNAIARGDTVAAEVGWEGTLAVPLGALAPGAVIRGHLAIFFELRDGKIYRQRNYDCYEPF